MTISWDVFLNSALMPYHFSVLSIFLLIFAETLGMYVGYRPSQMVRYIFTQWVGQSQWLTVKFSRFIIVIFFLINFSFAGYLFQLSCYAFNHTFFQSWIILPALLLAWFFTLFMIHCLDQVMLPKHQSVHVRLVGRLATIVSGHARPGFSAQASVRDYAGRLHYVQVEPEYGELELQTQVILVDYIENHYIAKKITPQSSEAVSYSHLSMD